ncbi:ferritin-3, chloroplastic, partial [Tanacetum coccineum]
MEQKAKGEGWNVIVPSDKLTIELALSLEKLTNEKLLNLHEMASRNNDVQVADFVESEFLGEQVEAINKLSEYVAQLRRIGKGHGLIQDSDVVELHNWPKANKQMWSGKQGIEVNVAAMSLLQRKQELDVTQTEADKAPKNQARKAFATSKVTSAKFVARKQKVIADTDDMFIRVLQQQREGVARLGNVS